MQREQSIFYHYPGLQGDQMKWSNAREYIKLNSLNDDYIVSGVQQKEALRGCDGKVHLQEGMPND